MRLRLLVLLLVLLPVVVAVGATVAGYIVFEVRVGTGVTVGEQPVLLNVSLPQPFPVDTVFAVDYYGRPLPYWIEDNNGTNIAVWVRAPPIQESSLITVYYGGDNPYTTYSTPYLVFDYFYNVTMEGWDTSKLSQVSGDPVSFSNGNFSTTGTAHLLGPSVGLPALLYARVEGVGGQVWLGLGSGDLLPQGSPGAETLALVLEPVNDTHISVRLGHAVPNGTSVVVSTSAPIVTSIGEGMLMWVDSASAILKAGGQQVALATGLGTPVPRVYLGLINTSAGAWAKIDFIASSTSWWPQTAVVPRQDLTPPQGTFTVTGLNPITTTTPPKPLPSIVGEAVLGQKSVQSRVVLLGTITAVVVAMLSQGMRLSTSLASAGALTMLLSWVLGETGITGIGAVMVALGITLSRIR